MDYWGLPPSPVPVTTHAAAAHGYGSGTEHAQSASLATSLRVPLCERVLRFSDSPAALCSGLVLLSCSGLDSFASFGH